MTGLAQNLSFILLGEDRTASKTMTSVEKTATVVTGRIGSAFQKLGGAIGGEFGAVLSEVGNGVNDLGSKAAKLNTALMVGGGIGVAAGIGLQQFGSSAKQATDQLNAAISSAGDTTSEYADKIEAAVKKGENFDHGAVDTKAALAKLTEATGSTQKALDNMQVVTDLAAAKHISLAEAAGLVARVLAGSGARTLAQYGITMEKATDPAKSLAAAQSAVTAASDRLAAAQKRVTDLQEIDHAKKKLTVSDHIAMQNAQDAVTKASQGLADAQNKLNNTSTVTISKTEAGKKALDELAAKLNGQGKASVNNFGSQVDIVKTKISDWAEEMAGPVGGALTALGGAATAVGVVLDIVKARHDAAAAAALAHAAAADVATTSTEAETGAQVALDGAMDANPIGLVAGALGVLAGVAGGIGVSSMLGLTGATHDYTAALQASNGVIDENVKKQAAQALASDGAFKAATKLGISHTLVLQATLGDKAAQAQLADELNRVKGSITNLSDPTFTQARHLNDLTGEAGATRDAMNLLQGAVDGESGAMKSQVDQINQVNAALNKLNTTAARGIAASGSRYAGQAAAYSRHAQGGDIMSSQFSLVGENGPEIVGLPAGSHVFPNGQGPTSSGGASLHIHLEGPVYGSPNAYGQSIATTLITALRQGHINGNELLQALGAAV